MAMRRAKGFSLVELVVVIVIIGLLAAIAIPRFSRGAAGAGSAAVAGNLAVLRNAVNLYAVEHMGKFPGDGGADVVDQLTKYSKVTGETADDRTGGYTYGPYLVAIPVCPVGNVNKNIKIDDTNNPPAVGGTEGWTYNTVHGVIRVNSNTTDEGGTAYSAY